MKKLALLLFPLLLFILAQYQQNKREPDRRSTKEQPHLMQHFESNCTECFEEYIISVIDNGLDIFHYPSGPMPAHTVSHEDAVKIAAYLATLQGLKPSNPKLVQDGKTLFLGNCTGCHGTDGKGQEGLFPDLTRRPLLGLQKISKKEYNQKNP